MSTIITDQATSVDELLEERITALAETHDVRAVVAALLAWAAHMSQCAIAAGITEDFIEGLWEGGAEMAFEPCAVMPEVTHYDEDGMTAKRRTQ